MSNTGPNNSFVVTAINAAPMTSNIVTTGNQNIDTVDRYSVQFTWTGSPSGSVTVAGSNDNVNYTQITSQDCGGAPGGFLLNVDNPAYDWVQVGYTFTSGS